MWVVDFVPTILAMIGRHLGISLSCILFSHLSLLGPTNIYMPSIQQVAITRSILSTEISSRLQVFTISIFDPKRYCVGGGFPMLSMWVVDFVPTILVKIVTTPTLILTLILILYAILESLCHVSHLAICRFWVLSTMAADGFNFCGLHTTGWNYSIHSLYRDQLSSSTSSALWSGKIFRGREPGWLYIAPLVSGFAPYLWQHACVPSSLPAILLFDQVYFSTTSFHFSLFLHVVKIFLDGWRLLRTSTCWRKQSNSVTAL